MTGGIKWPRRGVQFQIVSLFLGLLLAVQIAGLLLIGTRIDSGARAQVSGGIVLGLVGGEFTIKTYRLKAGGAVVLEAANPDFPDIPIGETSDFEVWGVVTGIVRTF